jgi:two-component sensor histidine kinase
MPAHVSSQGNGLGSRIIRALSAQLHGSVCLTRPLTGGTSLKVHFPDRR